MSLTSLKKNRGSALADLTKKLDEMNGKPQNAPQDERDLLWKPTVDKSGNGYAVIRFLPAPEGEEMPFVRIWDHGFQGPGGWFIEKSRTTLGEQDPVSELNSQLWASGREEDKDTVRKQKRRLSFYSNILVIKDPENPSNEGKVFLFKYGKRIFDKVNDLMSPQFEDESPVNPFDFWEGANFRLKIRNVEGYRNYDKSEFDSPTELADTEEELEAIWKQTNSLASMIDPKNFKSFDELQARLNKVLNLGAAPAAPVAARPAPAPAPAAKEDDVPWDTTPAPAEHGSSDASDDDDLSFFKSLAEED